MENKILIRVLLIGSEQAGKSCIMLKYINNFILKEYIPTIVVDCTSKSSIIHGKNTKICIFDSPGDEEYSTLTPAYWHLVDIIIFVACFKNPKSFQFVKEKEDTIFQQAASRAKKVIIMNKLDLKEQNCRSDLDFEEEIKIWAEQHNAEYYTCTIYDETSVNLAFEKVVDKVLKEKSPEKKDDDQNNSKKRCKCLII